MLANDNDAEGDAFTAALVVEPAHGRLELGEDGSFTYTPDPDYNGRDSFSYRANDGQLDTDPVTVTIDVGPVDDPPPPAGPASTPPAGPASTPPVGAAPPSGPTASAQPAIAQLRLARRCVRPSRSGRVRIRMSLRMARPGPLQIRIDRAVGANVPRSCPSANKRHRFSGRFRSVGTLDEPSARPAATAAAVTRRRTLRLRLSPGLYRISVRAKLDQNRLSAPLRRYRAYWADRPVCRTRRSQAAPRPFDTFACIGRQGVLAAGRRSRCSSWRVGRCQCRRARLPCRAAGGRCRAGV